MIAEIIYADTIITRTKGEAVARLSIEYDGDKGYIYISAYNPHLELIMNYLVLTMQDVLELKHFVGKLVPIYITNKAYYTGRIYKLPVLDLDAMRRCLPCYWSY